MTVPGTSCFSSAARRARAVATPAIAMRLCPQPCPIPGSASISAFTPTVRPTPRAPRLNSARQAVARPRYCRDTVNPREDMNSVRRSCAYLCNVVGCDQLSVCLTGNFSKCRTNLSSKLSSGCPEVYDCALTFGVSGANVAFAHHGYPNSAVVAHGRARGLYLRSSSSHPECDHLSRTSSKNMEGEVLLPPAARCQSHSCWQFARIRANATVSPTKYWKSVYG